MVLNLVFEVGNWEHNSCDDGCASLVRCLICTEFNTIKLCGSASSHHISACRSPFCNIISDSERSKFVYSLRSNKALKFDMSKNDR